MRPTDAAIKAAYRDETVPLRVWAARVRLPMSTLGYRIAQLGLSGRKQVHGGGMPRRFSDDQLRAAWHDRTRTVAELAAAMGTSQPRLSAMFRRLGLGKRVAVRGVANLHGDSSCRAKSNTVVASTISTPAAVSIVAAGYEKVQAWRE